MGPARRPRSARPCPPAPRARSRARAACDWRTRAPPSSAGSTGDMWPRRPGARWAVDSEFARNSRILTQERRIGGARFTKTLRAQHAAVAPPTRPAVRCGVVTAVREAVVEPKLETALDDLRFGERDERRMHAKTLAF